MHRTVRMFIVFATLAYFAGVAWLFARDFFPLTSPSLPQLSSVALEKKGSVPVAIRIPAITVSAKSQMIGLTPQGAIDIPTNYKDVAWFTKSPTPGSPGNSIIVGHRDTRLFAPGVFRHLKDLKIGDDVYVDDTNGKTLHFRVVAKKIYTEDTDRLAEIVGPTSRTRLNLITCEGKWNQSVRRYNERLVVFTELVI